jgi:ribbon-helix-helix CopG family protein
LREERGARIRKGAHATFGFPQGRSDYEPELGDPLDYVGHLSSGFREIEIGWDLWASCPNPCSTRVVDIPGYTGLMAKVMVSLPDDLLAEVDAEARRGGTTRSAVMRDFADAALRRRREGRAAAMRSLLSDASPHGGSAAEQVKATRPGP